MDRYNREDESRYDRGEPDDPGSEPSGSLGDFPWEDSGGGDQPPQVWQEPTPDPGGAVAPGVRPDSPGNPLAITGFVFSLLMWIPIPFTSPVFWLMALTFSSIGLSRSRRRGAPHKGLAIAGLCISLIGVVFVILLILFFVGAAIFSE